MDKNFKNSKAVESRELQKDMKKQTMKITTDSNKSEMRLGKETKPVYDSKTTSKIKKFFEQKSGKIQ
jgi:ribonucleotide reductase alpha subunit